MDLLFLILDRYSGLIVLLIVFLVLIFAVVRPGMQLLVEMQHRRKLEEMRKERAGLSEKPAEAELEDLLQQASAMGMTDQEHVRRLAQINPELARDQVRNWIHGKAETEHKQRRGAAKETV